MAVSAWKNLGHLRGLAMVLVVLNHAAQGTTSLYVAGGHSLDPFGDPLSFGVAFLLRLFTPLCVPAFVFASAFVSHRFVRTWPQALRAAGVIGQKYLIWSLGAFLVLALFRRQLHLGQMLEGLIVGGPFPAYWFLPLLIELTLLLPILKVGVERWGRGTALCALLLQVVAWLAFYGDVFVPGDSLCASLIGRPLVLLPVFVAGLFASHHLTRLMSLLERHRRRLAFLAVLLVVLDIAEGTWLGASGGWTAAAFDRAVANQRVTPGLLILPAIGLVLCWQTAGERLSAWLTRVGLASLGILFMVDAFQQTLRAVLWHLPAAGGWSSFLRVAQAPAPWIARLAWLLWPLLFVVGLYGPLLAIRAGTRLVGKRIRYLI
jgi:surface polysaccharide O-acyltransferase-like enzyme